MKAAGAQVIIVLSHLGYPEGGYGYGIPVYGDQSLARRLVDAGTPANLIIGGHSHTNLATATVISGTTIVQAYYNGRNVGRADIGVDTTSGTVNVTWQRISVSTSGSEDAATKARIATWGSDPAYLALINQPIGYTMVDLPRGNKTEAMMADFVDDAIYNYLNNDANPANDVDMFFNNAGGIRTDWCRKLLPLPYKIYLPIMRGGSGAGGTHPAVPGPYTWSSNTADCHTGVYTDTPMLLTYGNMFTILPFGNATVVGDMTGAQIIDVMNHGAEIADAAASPTGAVQPAGIKYMYYAYTDTLPGPQPYAWGAYSITVRNKGTGLYEPLVMTKTYRVGTNEFLAPAGGDNYSAFKYMTNVTYWGDMLNAVNAWVTANYTITTPYKGPNNNGTLDGRLVRNGTGTYGGTATEVVPVNILHHNDPHGRLLDYVSGTTTYPGYTRLATLIKQERAHNPSRTLLFNAGDTIQGDAMAAYYKAAFTSLTPDNQTLPTTLTVNPSMAAMNAMTYTAMTLGNHEFNYGNYIFTGTLGQANFPLLQANVYDTGAYGLSQINVRPYVTVSLPGSAGNIDVAVLGIGNHRIPNYELPSNIPGLTFTNPITEAQNRAPALKAANDAVIALTHIGFTAISGSLEVDNNVDTVLVTSTVGIDAVIGGHSHTNPASPEAPYKYLPTFLGAPDNTPVIINQAYRYNSYLGEVVLGLLPKTGGGYDVVAHAGRYIANSTSVAEDTAVKDIIQPYDTYFQTYKNRTLGSTNVAIDTTNAFITETNGANLQVDASLWKLNQVFGAGTVLGHLSGAMTNAKIPTGASPTYPYTMTVNDMFTLMPYENSLVVYRLTGQQLKAILERAYRNYWYYKNGGTGHGGYSYYTTCMLDIDAGGIITYTNDDPAVYTATLDHVGGLSFGNVAVDFLSASTYYTVSTVNYIAAGSCNFNNSGVTLWPFDQIVHDTQYYVRDVMIDYVPTLAQPIAPAVENRVRGIP
jgi:2',3'-cyclic-nucleotide 2'-phosphodiesterase (5'-nucleotidase family)